jgi:hypothetical protein
MCGRNSTIWQSPLLAYSPKSQDRPITAGLPSALSCGVVKTVISRNVIFCGIRVVAPYPTEFHRVGYVFKRFSSNRSATLYQFINELVTMSVSTPPDGIAVDGSAPLVGCNLSPVVHALINSNARDEKGSSARP